VDLTKEAGVDQLYTDAETSFEHWEVVKDLVDEMIDLMLNYRQSGHPGGSRSKVHIMLATLLSGAMRWDILRPWRRFGDRFVLSAGHTVPLVYACLAVLNEAMRARHASSGDAQFAFPADGANALTWEDLVVLRRNRGLAGHAEMEGKTLFLKWNTGPSGHGMPSAAGEALAFGRARNARKLVRTLRLARHGDTERLGLGPRHPRRAGGRPGGEPGTDPLGGLVQDAQGARLSEIRQRLPRCAAQNEQRAVLDAPQTVHGNVRRRVFRRR
jgi:hypothetical protein